jgi:serine/threonine-protein kinase
MGEVYYAHAMQTERTVALKILNTDVDGSYAFRLFEQEAYIMDHFEHPCLPKLAGFNKHHNYHYLAMNYVEGEGLDTILLREGPFNQIYILDMIIRLADLLDHVWRKFGAIHRDIKPANVMMTEDDQLILIDWGLAHIYNHPIENDTEITFGTPEYICPTIVSGETNPDYRTDIYSLGATCFHLVTGEFPFRSENAENVIDLVLAGNAPDAHELNSQVSPEVSKILSKMMALDYNDRYQNWETLVEDVEKVKMFLLL